MKNRKPALLIVSMSPLPNKMVTKRKRLRSPLIGGNSYLNNLFKHVYGKSHKQAAINTRKKQV